MLNHFNFKEFEDQYLITNDFGRYRFLDAGDFKQLVSGCVDPESEAGSSLREDGFFFEGSTLEFVSRYAPLLRSMKMPLLSATSLHIFVVTTACNLDCVYCQAHDAGSVAACMMDERTAERAVDIALSSPADTLSFEFQGGEPLLNFPVIKHAIEYSEVHACGKVISYSVVTNLTLITDEHLLFFKEHGVGLSTSLDGPRFLHDANRPFRIEPDLGSYDDLVRSVERVRIAGLHVGAIQTTTRASLKYAQEIVDSYCELGFENIFIRPLTPLGVARAQWNEVGYTPSEFGAFYREAIAAIIEKNRCGTSLREGHASMLLSKVFRGKAPNYMEMRSPCGAGVGQIAYHANGDVFTCDEGRMLFEMGDASFKLGNVYECGYEELVGSSVCRATCAASTLESIPSCCDCVYQPYCGVCPVVNLALESDLISKTPNGYHCGVYSEMFDSVFAIMKSGDAVELRILRDWAA